MEQITEDEILFIETWHTPKALVEILFHNWDNLNSFNPTKFGKLRLYQESLLSDEAIVDFELTAELEELNEQEIFDGRKRVGDLYCFGARKFGKSRIAMIMDLVVQMLTHPGDIVALGSVDLIHLKQILDPITNCFENHPICKLWTRKISGSPDYRIEMKTDWVLNSVNFNIGSKAPGQNFFGKHVFRLYIEESSLETEQVYEKRKDALSELGAVIRCVAEGSKVLMSDMSSKNIEDVKNGDKILAWDDKIKAVSEATVLNSMCTGIKDVINIATPDNALWLTPDHRILVNSEGEPVWRWIDSINVYKPKYNVKQFPHVINIDNYYKGIFLGLLDSDGSIFRGNITPIYCLHQSNEVEFFRFILNRLGFKYSEDIDKSPERSFAKVGKPVHTFRISTVCNDLINNIQSELFLNKDVQYGYLAGFIIGDGWIGNSGSLDLTQCAKNEYKIEKIKQVASLAKVPYAFRINKEDAKKFFISFHKYSFPFFSFEVKKCLTYRERMLRVHRGYYPSAKVCLNGFKSKVRVYDLETTTHSFIANGFIVHNCSGMTNFTPQSPAGKAFYSSENQPWVVNLPQYINPTWNENKQKKAEEEYGGRHSIGYRIYVDGAIIEDGISVFDMQRVRQNCIVEKKVLTTIEINKDRFKHFQAFISVDRPGNADRIFINADIGLNVTEINIISEVKGRYEYLYNITLNCLIDDEQATIIKYLAQVLRANVIAGDCGDGMGRAIWDELEKTIPKENLCRYAGTNKVVVGWETNSNGEVLLDDNGTPIEKEEFMSEWAVKRLKDLFYQGLMILPEDFKFVTQFTQVICLTSGTRIIYKCIAKQGDHLFDSFRVFAIAEWLKASANLTPPLSNTWGTGASN